MALQDPSFTHTTFLFWVLKCLHSTLMEYSNALCWPVILPLLLNNAVCVSYGMRITVWVPEARGWLRCLLSVP